jgi:hypothetical protein
LELIASGTPATKFKRIESDSSPEQMNTKMKFMEFSRAIGEDHRFELEVFECFQTRWPGHFLVKTLAAKLSVTTFQRTGIDDVVTRCGLATNITPDLLIWRQFGFLLRQQLGIIWDQLKSFQAHNRVALSIRRLCYRRERHALGLRLP